MRVRCRFFLLDVNEGRWEGKVCIRIWGIDPEGNRILILAQQILPYFYFLPATADRDSTLAKLKLDKKFSKVLDLTVERRKLLGNDQIVFKVICSDPTVVSSYAKAIPRILGSGQSFDDLRFPVRYMTDRGLTCCGWNECEVESVKVEGITVDRAYLATSLPHSLPDELPPRLRTLAFTTLTVAANGSARAEVDPVRAIGVATGSGESELFQTFGGDDSATLKSFVDYGHRFNPDIIVGFENNRLHWPYLIQRAKQTNEKLTMGRDSSEPHTSVFGHISIIGRANLDLSDLASGIPEVKVKTIENMAKFFQLSTASEIRTVDEYDLYRFWSKTEDRMRLLENTKLVAKACLQMVEAAIDYPMQLSAVTGLQLDQVMAAAVGFRVDSFFIRQAHQIGELIPTKNEQPFFTYQGAIVIEPETGLHENVAVLDFASMYPNLMMKYNLSPDALVKPNEEFSVESVYVIPQVGHRFRKTPDGFFRIVLTALIERRAAIKREMENQTSRSTTYRVLMERERAVKVITNACYGYAGWAGGRWYVREVAESATALGRETITKTTEKAKSFGLKILYSDTDSIFVINDKPKVERLRSWVKKEFELDIRIEREYTRILFTEAMKRYAGVRADGALDVVGLEAVRGDWSDIARQVQEQVLACVLKDQSTKKAVEGVSSTIRRLQRGEVSIAELTIRKTLTKPVEKYAVRSPHVEVARQLMREGWDLTLGDKVAYVITKGSGPLYKRAKPSSRVSPEEIDLAYYVENQVKPAAMRILERLGVDEGQLAV